MRDVLAIVGIVRTMTEAFPEMNRALQRYSILLTDPGALPQARTEGRASWR